MRFLVSKSHLCCRNRRRRSVDAQEHIGLCLQNALRIKKPKQKTSHYASKPAADRKQVRFWSFFNRKFKKEMKGAKNKKNHPKPAPKPDFGAKAEKSTILKLFQEQMERGMKCEKNTEKSWKITPNLLQNRISAPKPKKVSCFYTQPLSHIDVCTQTLLCTDAFTHLFAYRPFYTQALLHTNAFTHSTFTHRHFTHRQFYTQTLLHTKAFTQFYT